MAMDGHWDLTLREAALRYLLFWLIERLPDGERLAFRVPLNYAQHHGVA
jgi:hypothetical protein